jgi:hypothetical protein
MMPVGSCHTIKGASGQRVHVVDRHVQDKRSTHSLLSLQPLSIPSPSHLLTPRQQAAKVSTEGATTTTKTRSPSEDIKATLTPEEKLDRIRNIVCR